MSVTSAEPTTTHRPDPFAHPVTPHLLVDGAAEAIAFYAEAFGAVELIRVPAADGRLMHACVAINGAPVMLMDTNPEWGAMGPNQLGGTSVGIHLTVADADAAFARAVAAGATVKMEPQDMFWGDRYGAVIDPFGHSWSLATPGEPVDMATVAATAASMQPEC